MPGRGLAIWLRCTVDIRGGRNALLLELRSKMADESGVVVPIPTCEKDAVVISDVNKITKKCFAID